MIFNSTKEKFLFYKIPLILFSLIPLFLITGPFLSDLSISLIGLLFLIYCFQKKNFSYFKNKYFYFFLIFWLYLVFNSLINNINLDSIKISFFYFRYGIFIIAITTLIQVNSNFIKYFYYCIFICFTVLILDGFYEYFYEKNIYVTSFFGDEKILGSYISKMWPIFFGLSILINKQNKSFTYLLVLIFILSETLIFLSGERAAFFFINLSTVFILIFSKNLLKLRLISFLASGLLLIIISNFYPIAKQRIIDLSLEQINLVDRSNKKNKEIYIFSKEHTLIYKAAYKIFLDNKLLGVGVKNFRIICKKEKYNTHRDSCSTHPHNTYIQILAETGIIGFSFLIFIFFYFIKYLLIHFRLKLKGKKYFNDFEICLLSAILIYLWPIAPTGNIFNNWLNILLILNLAFLAWSRKLSNNDS